MLTPPAMPPPSDPPPQPAAAPQRDDPVNSVPYLTAELPGIGGALKQRIEDFLVEEQPLYQPRGEGEHIYLFVEKKNLSTMQMIHTLAKHFGVPKRAIGYAGMKDKHGITRQVISIHTPGRTYEDFPMIENDRISVLSAQMHSNKLRLGHLSGNRFSVKVRGVPMSAVLQARRIMQRLEREGVPNIVGEQRFGVRLNNHVLGRCYLREDYKGALDAMLGPDENFPEMNREARLRYAEGRFTEALDAFPPACRAERIALHSLETGGDARRAVQAIDIDQRRFWVTALQSAIFNRLLGRRIADGSWCCLRAGDVAMKHENGAMFAVDDAVVADAGTPDRLARFEISPTGPQWGVKMMRASGAVDDAEIAALAEHGLLPEDLSRAVTMLGDSMAGTRRSYRVPLLWPEVEGGIDEFGSYVKCSFELPPGAFATVVMREVMKGAGSSVEE